MNWKAKKKIRDLLNQQTERYHKLASQPPMPPKLIENFRPGVTNLLQNQMHQADCEEIIRQELLQRCSIYNLLRKITKIVLLVTLILILLYFATIYGALIGSRCREFCIYLPGITVNHNELIAY